MSIKTKLIAGAAGLAAVTATTAVAATPAEAQYRSDPTAEVLGAIIRGVLGAGNYGSYPYGNHGYNNQRYGYGMSERQAVDRCAAAVEARLNGQRYGQYDRYNSRYDQRYDQRYDRRYDDRYDRRYDNRYAYNNRSTARVAGITDVRRKSYGLKVYGVAMSGQYADQYNRYDRRGYGYNTAPDLKWDCKIERNGRIRDVDIERTSRYRR